MYPSYFPENVYIRVNGNQFVRRVTKSIEITRIYKKKRRKKELQFVLAFAMLLHFRMLTRANAYRDSSLKGLLINIYSVTRNHLFFEYTGNYRTRRVEQNDRV